MANKFLSISRRTRSTPFTNRVEAAGVKAYTVYNHMLLPTMFESFEADYWHLCEHVQVWDVSCERQIEIKGPDSERLLQLMTPRDIRKAVVGQGLYAPLCDQQGNLMNDPILIKFAVDDWWVSIADSDILLWAKGLASGSGLDVKIREADIWPLAVQGPKAETLVSRVFGDEVHGIRFFRSKMLDFQGTPMMVMRSGYSKQGGFEIYLNKAELGEPLWDALFEAGADLQVRAGGPNLIERIESGLLSFGNDMTYDNNPFECGLDIYTDLDKDLGSLGHAALRQLQGQHQNQLVGLIFDRQMEFASLDLEADNQPIGEIKSQAWSPRHNKHLAMAMIKRDFLAGHSTLVSGGASARIVDLPFTFD